MAVLQTRTDQLRVCFEADVDEVLISEDFAATLSVTGVDAETVRRGAKARWAHIDEALASWKRGFEDAQAALEEKQSQLESFRASTGSTVAAGAGWVLGVGGLVASVVLAIAFSPLWLFLLLFAGVPVALIAIPGEQRTRYRADLRIEALTRRRDATERLLKEAVGQHAAIAVREVLTVEIASYDTAFRSFDSRGLEQLADIEREIPTRASERLMRLMTSLSSGSIGLSGARGCGKTTVMHSFVAGGTNVPMERVRHGFVVSAPVRYDAREFVLHLFTRLCEEVLGEKGLAEMRHRWE